MNTRMSLQYNELVVADPNGSNPVRVALIVNDLRHCPTLSDKFFVGKKSSLGEYGY